METIRMSCFRTGGPGKAHGTNKPPPTRRVRERSKGDNTRPTTSQNPCWQPPARKVVASWLHQDASWLKTTRKLIPSPWNPRLPVTWQSYSPGFPYPTVLIWVPFPNKIAFFVSTCVSSDNSFPSVRQEPSFRPWKQSLFLQQRDDTDENVKSENV